jgi:lysophospholipase L1-like esterase
MDDFALTVLGDSVVCGVNADTYVGMPFSATYFAKLARTKLRTRLWEWRTAWSRRHPDRFARTPTFFRQFEGYGFFERRDLSCFLGSKPWSLPSVIHAWTGRRVRLTSFAHTGLCYSGLGDRADRILKRPCDLLVLGLGCNDFILLRDDLSIFQSAVERTFDLIGRWQRRADILVLLPNVPVELFLADPGAGVMHLPWGGTLTRGDMLFWADGCIAVMVGLRPPASQDGIARYHRRQQAVREQIETACERLRTSPGFAGRIIRCDLFPSELPAVDDWCAADCIHLSERAQGGLAQHIQEAIAPFFGLGEARGVPEATRWNGCFGQQPRPARHPR